MCRGEGDDDDTGIGKGWRAAAAIRTVLVRLSEENVSQIGQLISAV